MRALVLGLLLALGSCAWQPVYAQGAPKSEVCHEIPDVGAFVMSAAISPKTSAVLIDNAAAFGKEAGYRLPPLIAAFLLKGDEGIVAVFRRSDGQAIECIGPRWDAGIDAAVQKFFGRGA